MTRNPKLLEWVAEVEKMCTPDQVVWCDGSKQEYDRLMKEMVKTGMAVKLNECKRPNSFAFNSDPSDVARVETRTYIASVSQDDAGPTNNWIDPVELKKTMRELYAGCMKGRTLYIIPFSMGPIGSPIAKNAIELTDSPYVVVTEDKDVWWEDMGVPCEGGTDWKNNPWKPGMKDAEGNLIKGAHPNSRFTAPAAQCPVICSDWENPAGVPIDIFVFGGKRTTTVPLVHEAFDFEHGVFMGATAASEPTAAALDLGGVTLRFDPFAMTPFIGYHAGDYMRHWYDMGAVLGDKAPRCFYVNWFRKDAEDRFIWPGFGENSRILKWMCERVEGKVGARETEIGRMPEKGDLDLDGLDLPSETLDELLRVDTEAYKTTLEDARKYLAKFGDKLPEKITAQLDALEARLG